VAYAHLPREGVNRILRSRAVLFAVDVSTRARMHATLRCTPACPQSRDTVSTARRYIDRVSAHLSRSLRVLVLVATTTMCRAAQAQDAALVPDTTLPIPALRFDANRALVILPSATSSAHDFDYLVGTWKLRNRKLKSRLTHSTE
jgi:hypothetical protein